MRVTRESDPYLYSVNQTIRRDGVADMSLEDLRLPPIQETDGIRYAIHGDPNSKDWVVMGPTFLTPFEKPHFQVRASITQRALGDHSVLAVDHYPNEAVETRTRGNIGSGDYSYMSGRFLKVIDNVLGNKDANVFLSGYSLSADALIQLAHEMEHNPNRGIVPVVGLLAVEFARSVKRTPFQTLRDMKSSGKRMAEMVRMSGLRAIDEAWGVEDLLIKPKAYQRAVDGTVIKGSVRYFMGVDHPNIDVIKGSGTDVSTAQLREITSIPVTIARAEESTMTTSSLFEVPAESLPPNMNRYVIPGRDHGAGDHTLEDAARVLKAVRTSSN